MCVRACVRASHGVSALRTRYCAAFYFAIVTLTSVGYGDVHPQNSVERVYLIVVIMCGALLYGFFIGNMTQLTVKHDANFLKISAKMDHVASYVGSVVVVAE